MMMSSCHKAAKGFTLIEVMIALFILVVAMSALQISSMTNIDGSIHVSNKTIAQWVALNQLELLRLENRHSNQLVKLQLSGVEELAGRRWIWRATPQPMGDDEGLLPLTVSVWEQENATASDPAIISIMGVLDAYHRR